MAKPRKSYLQYVKLLNTYTDFVLALNEAGPKACKRFQFEERVRVLLARTKPAKKKTKSL